MHQLAAPGALRPRLVAGLPGRRPDRRSASTRRSSRSSTTIDGVRRATETARDRLPGRGRQRLRDLERVRQPLLAGALLRRSRTASSATSTSARDATSRSERVIQRAARRSSASSVPVEGAGGGGGGRLGPTSATPETYLGATGASGALPTHMGARRRSGAMRAGVASCSSRPAARITCRFHARDAHVVLSRGTRGARFPFRVHLDGEPPGAVARRRRRRGRQRRAPRRPHVPTRPPARRGPRADAGDHVPRARAHEAYSFTFG